MHFNFLASVGWIFNLICGKFEFFTAVQQAALEKQKEQGLNMAVITKRPSSGGKVSVKPTALGGNSIGSSAENACLPTPVTSFSVASLQQYTNSFDEDNLIRDGTWGKVYLAELPNGKVSNKL